MSLKLAARWLQNCQNEHEECSTVLDSHGPSRLLDLQAAPEIIRLVLTADTGVQSYATLSYSWGSSPTITLNQYTVEKLKIQIDVDELPQTIRDAIHVCKALDIRFL